MTSLGEFKGFAAICTPVAQALVAVMGLAGAITAHAGYSYAYVDYPGVNAANGDITQVFGIDDRGRVVGSAVFSATATTISFAYDYRTKVFTVLPNYSGASGSYTSALGTNDRGVIVGGESTDGGVVESAFVLADGAFTVSNHPGSTYLTEFRGIGRTGLVTGWADSDAGATFSCFVFDRQANRFYDFLTSTQQCIAQGINSSDAVVGGVYLEAGKAHPGSPAGYYGFRRDASGSIKYFFVNGTNTKGRGINNAGLVAGYVGSSSFVLRLGSGPEFEAPTIPADRLLNFPGAQTTFAEAVSDTGVVAGNVIDAAGAQHGFIAVPAPVAP